MLWTTSDTIHPSPNEVRVIPKNKVTAHVLSYYDQYRFYHDLTGFSREGFLKFAESNKIASQMLEYLQIVDHEDQAALAFKSNTGLGSIIMVMLLQENKVDLITFTNEVSVGTMPAGSYDVQRFKRWFSTMWPADPESTSFESVEKTTNRRWIIPPKIEDDGNVTGVVAVEIHVANDGRVIFARAGVAGTTLPDKKLWDRCESALRGARLNADESSPNLQKSVIHINFRANR